ncbi:uncharacterized protein LOC111115189 isoform X2 [Crassostrea virginica]|uniref:Uncharacterized protein LOC111113449 n=1 Tax=Crassostrea virginica TaxID=6565 RepID=A0A8B8BVR2_CRAVI|nr:uncharacterized protein LOC111113449 [Crassostrea virginica]XP_022307454.1 uncharacterized protein LOC111113449 [Crassostrea virginica]
MALQTISESVYVGLCLKIGTPQQVAIRRDVVDFMELLVHTEQRTNGLVNMLSGSQREGFRFKDSDTDVMIWRKNHRVLWDFSQAVLYNTHRYRLILCDSSESPPGFTLLWLPLEAADRLVISSCVRINGTLCISSAKYRENTIATSFLVTPDATVHGPCSSGRMNGLEYDYAFCFVSDFWPPSASSWTDRCHSYPPKHVVDDIIRSGCHFVAIGHKLGKHADNEWRISFSQGEQKLVYAMNHTQFLTYGLLKYFVKEIINHRLSEDEKLLCSYHMKTAIFWAIQQNTIAHWCPQNLLAGFWVCFKLLLKWVYDGYCPNFFIPENNMFLNKVHGEAQRNLFTKLYGLYEKGIAFLLQSASISSFIMDVLCNPRLSVSTEECTLISSVVLDGELFGEIFLMDTMHVLCNNLHRIMELLHIVEQLLRSSLTECKITVLQKPMATILQISAFLLHDMYTDTSGGNKQMYIADKRSCYMLKLAARFGCVSDLLYIAMYFYKTFRHREALSVIERTKVKLVQPGLMTMLDVDPERYTEAVGGRSWSYKMRHVAYNIKLLNRICYINELTPEQKSSSLNQGRGLFIPSFVLLHMLEFLCYRQVDPMKAQAALDDLQVLVHIDPGILVPVAFRDISWEILGICQQMTGNHQAALYSYTQSLRQYPLNEIHTATRHRIQDLH